MKITIKKKKELIDLYFGKIIDRIKDKSKKEFVRLALLESPDYFWVMPSSTTGKYHPPDEFCIHGLLIHIRKVCLFLVQLNKIFSFELDDMLVAGLLHDTLKCGYPGREKKRPEDKEPAKTPDGFVCDFWTDILHCMYPRHHFRDIVLSSGELVKYASWWDDVMIPIERHYGQWSPSPLLEMNASENILHVADFMVSKKQMRVEFEE